MKRYVFCTLVVMFCLLSATVWASENVVDRTYTFTQFGKEVGKGKITLVPLDQGRKVINEITYNTPKAEVKTEFVFKGDGYPFEPQDYTFAIKAPGFVLDMGIQWDEGVTYNIKQLDSQKTLSRKDLFPLDNNAIADYALTSWLLVSDKSEAKSDFGLILPVMMAQQLQIIDASVTYSGEEELNEIPTLKYVVSIPGLNINIWVDKSERLLVKLEIPAQGVKIIIDSIEEYNSSKGNDAAYNITEQDINIKTIGGSLAATLALPMEGVPSKGLILVAGSGPTDRDGNNPLIPGQVDNLKEIAQFLAEKGIATLRYDKRGIGDSSHLARGITPPFDLYKDDLVAAVKTMKSFNGIQDIYIAGHSEGATISIMAAREVPDIDGLILLAGPGFPHGDLLKTQIGALQVSEELKSELLRALDDLMYAIREDVTFDIHNYNIPQEYAPIYLSLINQRDFTKGWIDADPPALLRDIKVPVCIIQGDADTQVSVDDAHSLALALPEENREIHIFSGVDHVLKETGDTPLPYGDPNRRVSPKILQLILDFIN